MKQLKNIHPGEVLLEEFLVPYEISAYRLSKDIGIPQTRVSAILKGRRRITADTALRLSAYFQNSPKFWIGLQSDFDLEEERKLLGQRLKQIPRYSASKGWDARKNSFISPLTPFLSCFCRKRSGRKVAAKTDIPPRAYAIRIRVWSIDKWWSEIRSARSCSDKVGYRHRDVWNAFARSTPASLNARNSPGSGWCCIRSHWSNYINN